MAAFPQIEDQATPPVPQPDEPAKQEQATPQYGEWNERLPEELRNELMELDKKFVAEDRFARRMEVQDARRQRYFWRSLQNLYWDWRNEGWQVYGPPGTGVNTSQGSQTNDSAVLYVTNIYQAFGRSIIAVLTQNTPSTRFFPENPDSEADLSTARAGNKVRRIIEHENDPIQLMTKAAYYSWTDGRVGAWTRLEQKGDDEEKKQVVISVVGSMELKVPITAECMEDYTYLQYSDEYHESQMRDEISKLDWEEKDYWKKIRGGAQGNTQDVYERTARISVKQGIGLVTQSGETLNHLVTYRRTWMRPQAFWMIDDDTRREQLREMFPKGVLLRTMSGTYAGSKAESMDDHWAICHPLPGDGQYRNSQGTVMVSVQERFNDIINITQDVYEKTLPASWWNSKMFDVAGMAKQRSTPSARYPVPDGVQRPGEPISNSVFFEPAATVSPDMLQYGENLMGPLAQFLTGAFPALFGGNIEGGKTAAQYSMARDQAMGNMGLIWRAFKKWYSKIMEQAVRLSVGLSELAASFPSEGDKFETVRVTADELKGSIYCYPETDENFPEGYVQKRSALFQLLQLAGQNPAFLQMIFEPDNLEQVQSLIGLEDFVIPAAEARNKQIGEIEQLLAETPIPNPALEQLKAQYAQMTMASQAGLLPDGAVEALTAAVKSTTPFVSSVPIDPQMDDNAAEFTTCKRWFSSPEGIAAKRENQPGAQNVRLHALEHMKALVAQAPVPPPAPAPPHIHLHGAQPVPPPAGPRTPGAAPTA